MSWIHKFASHWHNDGHMEARRQSMKPGGRDILGEYHSLKED